MTQPRTLAPGEAMALVSRALEASNCAPAVAACVAEALVRAETDGQTGHGLSRVPYYAAQARAGKVDGFATPTLADSRPGVFRVDAAHGFAYPAISVALPELVRRTRAQGIAACAIARSHHFGVAGHPCEDLAAEGLVAFIYGNAPAAIAPWGGHRPLFGTNPIAFAAPTRCTPLVIDLAVSRVAKGKIMAAAQAGKPIPEGWAFAADGTPTTDAEAAMTGTLAPMGDAKGVALALMVEIMSACLVGSALGTEASSLFDDKGGPPNLGQTIVALDPVALSGGAYAERMEALLASYAAVGGARLPGTRRLEARKNAARQGLGVAVALVETIEKIGGGT
jgi:(2R)-3-sulfolactate dehydrogenase (NADP+)